MKTEYDGMKILSTVLREQGITRRPEILEFVRNAELIKLNGRDKIDSKNAEFTYSDTKSSFRMGKNNSHLYASDILVVSGGEKSIEDFRKTINELDQKIFDIEKEKDKIKAKILFMKDSESESFNDKEYRAYEILKTIVQRNELSDFEKLKIISELIK